MSGEIFDDLIIKDELVGRIAVLLAGRIAEARVFGEGRVTSGSSADIARATNLALEAVKRNGLGISLSSHREVEPCSNLFFHDYDRVMEETARAWLKEAERLASMTMEKHEALFIELAEALFKRSVLRKAELEILIRKHLPDFKEKPFLTRNSCGVYVDLLMAKANTVATREGSCPRIEEGLRVAYSTDDHVQDLLDFQEDSEGWQRL
jgi:cell division protease FtsH